MKLDPVLIDSRNFGRPSYGFPWSRFGERPRIQVPYQRFHDTCIPDDFWEPVVPERTNRGRYDSHQHQPIERVVPIKVERHQKPLSKQQKKYEYVSDEELDEDLNLAIKLSVSACNENNNGTHVRRRRSDSGSRNAYATDLPSSSFAYQTNSQHGVIEIEDDDFNDPPPVPPPRTTSLMSDSQRRTNRTYVDFSKRDSWKHSDDSDSEIVFSLVPVTPKVTKSSVDTRSAFPSTRPKHFYIGSSDENESDEVLSDGRSQRYGYYKGMEVQNAEFSNLMHVDSGDSKMSGDEVRVLCDDFRDRQSACKEKSNDNIVPVPSYPAYNIIKQMISREGRQVDYIHGDGNCFFRALSKVIYGSESCHEEIRQAVVDMMEKFPKEFEQFIDSGLIHEHLSSMRKLGTWGTQAEIYGAATLLQRDIYILSPDHTGENYRWLLFSPRFVYSEREVYDKCYITLCHTNGNHYDRIAPLHGECNCHLLKPRLSGVKAQIDLTDEIV